VLDAYGDIAFTCKNKGPLSDSIRDGLFLVAQSLAPLATICNSPRNVHLEPMNLLPLHPLKRPGDVGIALPPPASSASPSAYRYLALDVTVPAVPRVPANPHDLPESLEQHPLTKAHHDRTRSKFLRKDSPDLIREVNENHIYLSPFTVDHLGGLGYHAHCFFFGRNARSRPPPKPPYVTLSDLSGNDQAHHAYAMSFRCPSGLFPRADASWRELTPDAFGATHHTSTPSSWGYHFFAQATSNALLTHLSSFIDDNSARLIYRSRHLSTRRVIGPSFLRPHVMPAALPLGFVAEAAASPAGGPDLGLPVQ
jgi:hypothetical protein